MRLRQSYSNNPLLAQQGSELELRTSGGNIVVLIAIEELSGADKIIFHKILHKDKIIAKDVEVAIDLIKKTDSYRKSMKIGRSFIAKAKKELSYLPQNRWNIALNKLADFMIERER